MVITVPRHLDPADDEAILALSRANPLTRIEVAPSGHLLISFMVGTSGGSREAEAIWQLQVWARAGAGGKVFSSNTGFRLPDMSLRSPDASWIGPERLRALSPAATEPAFWRTCPEIVIEILSETDGWSELLEKIDSYEKNGAAYVVALDPFRRAIAERGKAPDGFALDTEAIFDA